MKEYNQPTLNPAVQLLPDSTSGPLPGLTLALLGLSQHLCLDQVNQNPWSLVKGCFVKVSQVMPSVACWRTTGLPTMAATSTWIFQVWY